MGTRFRELALLLAGDMLLFVAALWATLLVRYLAVPDRELFLLHLTPFLLLTVVWLFVFWLAGLYDKHTLLLKSRLTNLILKTQVGNFIFAALFFFVEPFFIIAPKTNLLIYLVISSLLILAWRVWGFPALAPQKHYRALLIADGEEAEELTHEINGNSRYDYEIVRLIDHALIEATPDFQERILTLIKKERITILIADARSPLIGEFLPTLFNLTFLHERFTFLDFHVVYEETFDRIPLSCLRYDWFLLHLSQSSRVLYDTLKRAIDIAGAFIIGMVFLTLLPFVVVAIKLEDGGDVFIEQKRIGRYNRLMRVWKLRTMAQNKSASAEWLSEEKQSNPVTKVGQFLRTASIDELPQVWNVLIGELSLIGPRNDIEGLGTRLAEEIPYYNIRYFITPGITGWAQTNQRYAPGNYAPQSLEESRLRLAYDLFYIKNRSLLLDIIIALRTFKTLISRFSGSIRMS